MLNLNKFFLLPAISLLLYNVLTNGFNIDTKCPIIIKNSADGSNSHFGITVLIINDTTDPGVIVGSPKSASTLPAHPNISEPGVVWQCSFRKTSNVCRVVVMDPTGNVRDPLRPKVVDRKDGGWLGGALAEDGDDFLACGSRWSNQEFVSNATTPINSAEEKDYYMNGICYWRPKEDIFKDPLPALSSSSSRILPIVAEERQPRNEWSAGQAGFSIHTPKNTQQVLLGAPGVNKWRGSVIQLSNNSNSKERFGNTFVWDSEVSSLQLQRHSYFGFAIDSGKFFKSAQNSPAIQYVSAAPRGRDLKGQVVVFKMPLETSGDIFAEMQGTQIGSYFGSALCVADLNGDGWDDLMVGAPLYSIEYITPRGGKTARFISGNGDEGTVFIYLSNGNKFEPFSRINGHQPWSHFGSAISNLGDINDDGYQDIAIGAPYANGGSGVVYIYHGSKNGIVRERVQEIEGKSLNNLLKGFGYSMSSGKDIDQNGYNDLAVGAYESGHVVLLRSRPLISFYGEVKSRQKKLSFDATTFEIESCVRYNASTALPRIDFTVTISADLLSIPKRVFLEFPEQSPSTEHTYQETLYAGQESCTKFIAVVKVPLESTGKPVVIRQTNISVSEGRSVQGPTFYNIVSRFGEIVDTRVSGIGYGGFCKTCALKNSAASKTTELLLPLAVPCGSDDKCVSDIQIDFRFLELRPEEKFIIGSSPVLSLEVKVDNKEEPAISPSVRVSWNSKTLRKTPSQCHEPWSNDSHSEITCPLGRLLEQNKPKTILFELDMSEIDAGSMDELVIQIDVSTASEVKDPATMTKIVTVALISQADIFMVGSKTSAKFNLETLSPKTILLHNYEVGLDGPSSIAGAVFHFHIPVTVEHPSGPKTNFDVGEPTTSVTGPKTTIACYPESGSFKKFSRITVSKSMGDDAPYSPDEGEESGVTPDSVTDDYEPDEKDALNSNYSTSPDVKTGGILGGKARKELIIACGDSSNAEVTVKCMDVRCRIYNMNAGGRITVGFPIRVASSRLKSLFKTSMFTTLKYVSSGGARMLGLENDIHLINVKPDNATAISVIEEEIAKPVSHLIYLLGLFIGLLIIALIVYCLYRSGLFERKKPPQASDEPDSSEPLKKEEPQQNDEEE